MKKDAPIPYSGNPLDRQSARRTDASWVARRLEDPETRFLPFWRLQVLVKEASGPELAWARRGVCEHAAADPGPVLLGEQGGTAHFAVDLSALPDPLGALGLEGEARFSEPHAVIGALPSGAAGIIAQARGMLTWHARHRYCSACGEPTRSADAGYVRRCPSCNAEHFPRTDPVVIMLPVRDGRCLLGRQPAFPRRMWSALAGFLEPGETIEEAVRREVAEEAGLQIGAVRYQASQPWPFPASLMIGCIAFAESEEIRVATDELEDARWFARDELARALAGDHPDVFVPPPMAIAHHLLRAWLAEE
jgi:NAD+ diphosphatase